MDRRYHVRIDGPMTNSVIGDHNTNTGNTTSAEPDPPDSPAMRQEVPVGPYDLAFSFAGEDRSYVRRTKVECEALGLSVMYDKDLSVSWWGENFLTEQRRIYGQRTRFFVPFISKHYFRKPIPTDEFAAAMWTDARQGGGYILPVLIGGITPPADRLHPHVGYLRAAEYPPARLAAALRDKVHGRSPKRIDEILPNTTGLRPSE